MPFMDSPVCPGLFWQATSVKNFRAFTVISNGVAPITQNMHVHVHNKKSNNQGSSPYVVKVIFHFENGCN